MLSQCFSVLKIVVTHSTNTILGRLRQTPWPSNDGRFKDIDATSEDETKYVFLTKDGLEGGVYNIFFAESADDDTDFSEIRLVGTVDASDGFETIMWGLLYLDKPPRIRCVCSINHEPIIT